MLLLVAFDLSFARGIPADVAAVSDGDLPGLIRQAEETTHHGRPVTSYEVCEIWGLLPGQRPVRVARRRPGMLWLDADGLLLDDVRQWALVPHGSPQVVEPLPHQIIQ